MGLQPRWGLQEAGPAQCGSGRPLTPSASEEEERVGIDLGRTVGFQFNYPVSGATGRETAHTGYGLCKGAASTHSGEQEGRGSDRAFSESGIGPPTSASARGTSKVAVCWAQRVIGNR